MKTFPYHMNLLAGRRPVLKSALLLATFLVTISLVAQSPAQAPGGKPIKRQDFYEESRVLTPGEADDWPLRTRDGETVILAVASRAFDAAVQLVGPAGQIVAENDDARPGEQNPVLVVRLDQGGEYLVRVKSYKSAQGGLYKLTVRRFVAAETQTGLRTVGVLGKSSDQWYRFEAKEGQTLTLTARAAAFAPTFELCHPNGEIVAARPNLAQPGVARLNFRPGANGTHFLHLFPNGNGQVGASFALTITEARYFQTAIGQTHATNRLPVEGLDLWLFEGKAGDVIRLQATGGALKLGLMFLPPRDKSGALREPDEEPFTLLPVAEKSTDELVARLNVAGNFQAYINHPYGLEATYKFTTSRPAKPLPEQAEAKGIIGLGEAEYWTITAKTGDILRITANSEQFDTMLELFGPRGEKIAENDDGAANRNALLTVLLTESGAYLLRVHSFGDGGSGAYRLQRAANPAKPLDSSGRAEGVIGDGGSDIWSFQGHAGQTVIVSARSTDFDIKLAVYGPDGAEVAANDGDGDAAGLLSARLPINGVYTIWVSAKSGGGKYGLRFID